MSITKYAVFIKNTAQKNSKLTRFGIFVGASLLLPSMNAVFYESVAKKYLAGKILFGFVYNCVSNYPFKILYYRIYIKLLIKIIKKDTFTLNASDYDIENLQLYDILNIK